MKTTAILVPLALLPVLAQQPTAQQPRFELADVHVSPTAFWFAQNTGGQIRPGLISDGLYIYRDATVLSLIESAYGVTEDMVSGGPSWLKSDLFDVVAKVPEGTTPANLKLMLQSLLADRFALEVQTESRNLEQGTGFFDHPIVDETGLQGGWDFMMAVFNQNQPRPTASNQQNTLPDAPEGLFSYDAIQKQLGLKLVKTKRSIPVIVVDHVDEKPIE